MFDFNRGKMHFVEINVRVITFQSDIVEHYHLENYLLPSGLRPRSRKGAAPLLAIGESTS